jgi:hypothetical protein
VAVTCLALNSAVLCLKGHQQEAGATPGGVACSGWNQEAGATPGGVACSGWNGIGTLAMWPEGVFLKGSLGGGRLGAAMRTSRLVHSELGDVARRWGCSRLLGRCCGPADSTAQPGRRCGQAGSFSEAAGAVHRPGQPTRAHSGDGSRDAKLGLRHAAPPRCPVAEIAPWQAPEHSVARTVRTQAVPRRDGQQSEIVLEGLQVSLDEHDACAPSILGLAAAPRGQRVDLEQSLPRSCSLAPRSYLGPPFQTMRAGRCRGGVGH